MKGGGMRVGKVEEIKRRETAGEGDIKRGRQQERETAREGNSKRGRQQERGTAKVVISVVLTVL